MENGSLLCKLIVIFAVANAESGHSNLIPKKVLVSRLVSPIKVVHSSDHH